MKIVELRAENIKKLKCVRIKPDGSLVVIGGQNGQGKTSVLDSIWMALGGKSAVPGKPIRDGEDHAEIELNLGDLIVRRTFTESGGGTLKVLNKDGASYGSPQTMLDGLVNKICFDPLAFSRMDSAKQAETLRMLVGLDTSKFDDEYAQKFEERKFIKKSLALTKGKFIDPETNEKLELIENVPSEYVDITELISELEEAIEKNKTRDELKRIITSAENDYQKCIGEIEEFEGGIAELKNIAAELKNQKDKTEEELENTPVVVVEVYKERVQKAHSINENVRKNKLVRDLQETMKRQESEVTEFNRALDNIRNKKARAIADAKIPITGLSFGDDGVVFNGIPFDQAALSEQLRISVAMGIAMNPKLKVLLIRDGSLLDEDNVKLIAEMAEKNRAQVWLEVVGQGEECQVIMEDGEVKK